MGYVVEQALTARVHVSREAWDSAYSRDVLEAVIRDRLWQDLHRRADEHYADLDETSVDIREDEDVHLTHSKVFSAFAIMDVPEEML